MRTDPVLESFEKKISLPRVDYDELKIGPRIVYGMQSRIFKGIYKGKWVAIKEYYHPGTFDVREWLYRESYKMAQLSSLKHVAQALAICLEPPCLVTEYCENGSLFDLLENTSIRMTYPEKLRLVAEISSGLHMLYTRKIIHCDLRTCSKSFK